MSCSVSYDDDDEDKNEDDDESIPLSYSDQILLFINPLVVS